MQFKAGYIADSIAKIITEYKSKLDDNNIAEKNKLLQINGLLQYVSSFEVVFPYEEHTLDFHNLNPVLATINNIITRGLPTRMPVIIETIFADIGLTYPNESEFELKFPNAKKKIDFETIFELLHILEPKLEISKKQYGGFPGSLSEWNFLDQMLKEFPFAKQILQSQRDFSTISKKLAGGRTLDFSYEFPYHNAKKNDGLTDKERKGVIFEFDGPDHQLQEVKFYDKYRDEEANENNFETLRQSCGEVGINLKVEKELNSEYFDAFKTNYKRDIKEYLDEYYLLFIPLAVARIQKTIIEFLLKNLDEFNKKEEIKIAIIERDLPCGAIAIASLQEFFENINELLENKDKLKLPKVNLTIFDNKKWVINKFKGIHLDAKIETETDFNSRLTNSTFDFDIVIDHSILRRSDIYNEKDFICKNAIKIRSSHYFDTNNGRKVYCAKLLDYKELVKKQDDGSYIPVSKDVENNINFFIQNIFRKVGFREGQLPIISRALQQKPVIGLLPTGGGKSLTFQLPTFLQPGLCLVVDPIKSLMEDQVRVLKENWIDCCDFINSNDKREVKFKKLVDFRFGETMFLFISPERFVMEDFRNIIKNIDVARFGLGFSYCVIDEVHCVSEWGHDFRSTYLMLGKNAQRFTTTKSKKPVSLMGLTATASFDVLADIERELDIKHDDVANAIIMIENTIRPELFFRVIDVTGEDSKEERINALKKDFGKIGKNLSKINEEEILKQSLMHHYVEFENSDYGIKDDKTQKYTINETNKDAVSKIEIEFKKLKIDEKYLKDNKHKNLLEDISQNEFYGIVFCPVKGKEGNKSGVDFVYDNLTSDSKGFFYASDTEELSTEVQKHFKDFTTDKTKHIVCTKAFGMGIDKSDIRSTYHYFYSGSLESLVQEAGRSGRDKKISEANILVSKTEVITIDYKCLLMLSNDDTTNNPIKDTFHRTQIRRLTQKGFFSIEECSNAITNVIDRLNIRVGGHQQNISQDEKDSLIKRCENFIKISYQDRNIHNFFYQGSFKGIDTEISQFYSLFKEKEFTITSRLKNLNEEFNLENNADYLFKFWREKANIRLYISDYDETDLGFINLSLPIIPPKNEKLLKISSFLRAKNEGKDDVFNLFTEEIIDDTLNEGTFIEVFNSCETDEFPFIITPKKIFPDNFKTILKKITEIPEQTKVQATHWDLLNTLYSNATTFDNLILNIQGQYQTIGFKWCTFHTDYDEKYITRLKGAFEEKVDVKDFLILIYEIQIERSFENSKGSFPNFLLLLEENIAQLKFSFDKKNDIERWLKLYYNRSRHFKPTNDTGRLIYRMHCMGLLTDYEIDYRNGNLFICTFKKYQNIEDYVDVIDKYLKRYLSEQTVIEKIKELESKLTKPTVIENILECLYFLAEFSYKEIATKRTRATDEIEDILNKSITDEAYTKDWFKQNLYIKEQIYFYFNAKYARAGFKINGKPFSLLDDYKDATQDKASMLNKYLGKDDEKGVFQLEGTEQNNYKHMMGSCKKILRSLSESDLKKEWLLRLLKAFSMYAVNNASYISEANEELEKGFVLLYEDDNYHQNDYEIINPIFKGYFEKLEKNIKPDNPSFEDIKEIRKKILFLFQIKGIENFITENQKLTNIYHA